MADHIEVIDLCESLNSLDCSDILPKPTQDSSLSNVRKDPNFAAKKDSELFLIFSSDDSSHESPDNNVIVLTDSDDFFSDDDFWKAPNNSDTLKSTSKSLDIPSKKALCVHKQPLFELKKELYRLSSAKFRKERIGLSASLYDEINSQVMGNRLPMDMKLFWSKTLNKTAGRYHYSINSKNQETKHHIELSTKVLDSYKKLESTLAHEMCHAAAHIIDGAFKPPHGIVFKSWAKRVHEVFPNIQITIRHQYTIAFKHWYMCTGAFCNTIFRRHSKSIDLTKQVCGLCKSRLEYLPKDHPKRLQKPDDTILEDSD